MAKFKSPLDRFRFNVEEKKNPELYWGLRVAIPYNLIGIAFGILVRMGQFPEDIGDIGTAILFLFVPVSAQIIEFEGATTMSLLLAISNLVITFFLSWVIFSPIVGLFRGILGFTDK